MTFFFAALATSAVAQQYDLEVLSESGDNRRNLACSGYPSHSPTGSVVYEAIGHTAGMDPLDAADAQLAMDAGALVLRVVEDASLGTTGDAHGCVTDLFLVTALNASGNRISAIQSEITTGLPPSNPWTMACGSNPSPTIREFTLRPFLDVTTLEVRMQSARVVYCDGSGGSVTAYSDLFGGTRLDW